MSVHTMVPASRKEPKIDPRWLAEKIEQELLHQIEGKARAKTSGELMRMLGLQPSGTNERLRAAAKILLKARKIPMVSCTKGFYLATSVREVDDYIENLEARAMALWEDVADLKAVRDEMRKKQRELF